MDDNKGRSGMTVAQMRDWLRDWVITTTGLTPEEVTPERPMEEFGLSSRDIVILSGELEKLLGRRNLDMFCLNDGSFPEVPGPERAERMTEFLERYYPIKAPWEK